MSTVKALTFDVFGTVLDWRGSIIGTGYSLTGYDPSWDGFALEWARRYAQYAHDVASGAKSWTRLDETMRRAGLYLIEERAIKLDLNEQAFLSSAWEFLLAWPGAVSELHRLSRRYVTAPLSNANVEMMEHLSRHAGLEWDLILGTNSVQTFKPNPAVYQMAVNELALEPQEIAMVAAHLFDLEAAKAQGFKTVFVRRVGEEKDDPAEAPYVDLIVDDFNTLTNALEDF